VLTQRVGEILAVGDEGVDEAEDLADARRHGPIGMGWTETTGSAAASNMNGIRTQDERGDIILPIPRHKM
jgi:hypothetical protein